jgi:hypothetical protein
MKVSEEYMKDRFRVVDMTQSADVVEHSLNKYSGAGYVPSVFFDGKCVMVKQIEEGDVLQGEDFTFQVPGAQGNA